MRHILLAMLVLFCWNLALAQDEAPPTEVPSDGAQVADETAAEQGEAAANLESAVTYQEYIADGFGFKIPIPTTGELDTPGDFGWNNEPEVAFVWFGEDNNPVTMVELRADNIGTEISPDRYAEFYDTLVSEWEGQPSQFKVLRSRAEPYHFGDMDWLIIEVEDNSAATANSGKPDEAGDSGNQAATATVYYTIFTTFHGEVFYTIGFYYLQPVSEAVQSLAVPMLRGFSIIE